MSDIIQQQDNRREFIDTLCKLAREDDKIVFIVPDVGFNYAEKFQKEFPNRYFNLGVTEQSSMIVAAAMALDGYKPYVYSMIPFVTFRVLEMVRNAVRCHGANVKILGVKGSEKYKMLGFSHNLLWEDEDIQLMEKYVNVYRPDSINEVNQAITESYESGEAAYIRL